jgi:hypothetical protein
MKDLKRLHKKFMIYCIVMNCILLPLIIWDLISKYQQYKETSKSYQIVHVDEGRV